MVANFHKFILTYFNKITIENEYDVEIYENKLSDVFNFVKNR